MNRQTRECEYTGVRCVGCVDPHVWVGTVNTRARDHPCLMCTSVHRCPAACMDAWSTEVCTRCAKGYAGVFTHKGVQAYACMQTCAGAGSTLPLISGSAHVVTSESRGGGGLERNVSSIQSPQRSCRGPAVSSQQLTTIPNFGFPGSDTLFRLPQSPGCMQASVHANKINFPIFTCYLFPQPQIHPLYLLPCSVCATLRDCAGLTEETLSKASSQEQPVADRGLRSREVTVLSQSRLPGEGYRASGKGGQVLFGELLPREV